MATNALILTRNSLLSLRFMGFPRLPISQLHTRTGIHPPTPHTTRPGLSSSSISSSSHGLKSLYLSDIGPKRFVSSSNFQLSAVSGDGGGGFGGSGDGNSSGGDNGSYSGGGGEGEKKWSLLAWLSRFVPV